MVSNEEIKRRLELRRKGVNPNKELNKEDEISCSKCGTVNLEDANFCIGCGNELNKLPEYTLKINEAKSNMIICPSCGTENKIDSKFCIDCGSNLLENSAETNEVKVNSLACPECSFENNPNSKFCIGCGTNLKEASNKENTEEKEVQITIKDGDVADKRLEYEQETISCSECENSPDDEIEDVQASEVNILDEIKKAKDLLDMGAISPEEYQKIKVKYLDLL
jgi:hypothetical protein